MGMVYNNQEDTILVFGGQISGLVYSDLMEYNIKNNIWKEIKDLSFNVLPISRHSCTYLKGTMICVFGIRIYTGPRVNVRQMLEYSKSSGWRNNSLTTMFPLSEDQVAPNSRSLAAITTDNNNNVYLLGGQVENAGAINEFWKFDIILKQWTKLPNFPLAVIAGELFFNNGDLYFYGGNQCFGSRQCYSDDVYHFDLNTGNTWKILTPKSKVRPSFRTSFGGAVCKNKIYIMGGEGASQLDDFYEFDLTSLEWKEILTDLKPPGRMMHSLVATSDSLYLFGGYDANSIPPNNYYNDLWRFDLSKEL